MSDKGVLETLSRTIFEAMPNLSEAEQRIAIELYRALAEGNPVENREIARRAEIDEAEVDTSLGTWPGIFRDDDGRIVGFWGLALPEMPHRFEVDGVEIHTWCAWDPLFIAPLLGKPGNVESKDPITGEIVSLTVTDDGVENLSHPDARVSFLTPSERWDENVIQGFCHYVLFFATPTSGQRWVEEHPDTFLLSVDEAFKIGRRVNALQFGQALAAVS